MSQDEESRVQKGAKSLQNLTNTLSSSLSNLSSSSRSIPTERDFHFYYNFPEFILPVQDISSDSHSLLDSIGTSQIWNQPLVFPEQIDIDEAYDWLVNVNDEVYERFDMSLDEIEHDGVEKNSRGMDENGFQTVYGKKKKGEALIAGDSVSQRLKKNGGDSLVAKMKKEKGKIPFHIATIKRPQEEYNILVNNSNQPFQHVWLQRSYDDMRFIHPLEKLSVMDFVDKDVGNTEPVKPASLEDTRFKLVEDVKDLKELAAKLRSVNEFAVDLEHNQYRSFQGLTCLMQISTRTEDFVVDTLKLRIHVGPYLREVFKDPTKKKVMHGADRDIVWLQRDFGIYLCNMFDTGQASRVLKLERNSLEHLLQHFCGVTANKEYQNADWRLRPLPEEMIRYGREDTHYLLYIYDLMKIELSKLPKESEDSDPPLVEVYKRSYDICMQLYEKDLLTENTYLHIYGLQDACLDAKQLAVVAGLCEWRDVVARAEDESTGYILPNKTLLEIAKQMPDTTSKLRRMLKSRHTYLDRNLSSVVSIVKHSVLNAAAFEEVSKYLKEKAAAEAKLAANNESEATNSSPNSKAEISTTGSLDADNESNTSPSKEEDLKLGSSITKLDGGAKSGTEKKESGTMAGVSASAKVAAVCVPALKKPSHGFGALLGAVPKRKFDTDKKVESSKLEQIRSSVTLPFQSFSPKEDKPKSTMDDAKILEAPKSDDSVAVPGGESNPDVIMLADSENEKESTQGNQEASNVPQEDNSSDKEDGEPMSLSDLSSSFQKCFDSVNQNKNPGKPEKSEDGTGFLQLKPYDFEKARKEIKFGEGPEGESAGDEGKNEGKKKSKRDSKEKKKGSDVGRLPKDDGTRELLPQGRRRQAFPASGNRSATFR